MGVHRLDYFFIVWPGMPWTNIFGKTLITTALLKLLLDFVLESKKQPKLCSPSLNFLLILLPGYDAVAEPVIHVWTEVEAFPFDR